MAKRTGPENPELIKLIEDLKILSYKQKVNIWRVISEELQKPTRQRRIVNLSKISRHTKENEMVVVPGKVLGTGNINHKIIIAAFSFSGDAKSKLKGCSIMDIEEAIKNKDFKIIK